MATSFQLAAEASDAKQPFWAAQWLYKTCLTNLHDIDYLGDVGDFNIDADLNFLKVNATCSQESMIPKE